MRSKPATPQERLLAASFFRSRARTHNGQNGALQGSRISHRSQLSRDSKVGAEDIFPQATAEFDEVGPRLDVNSNVSMPSLFVSYAQTDLQHKTHALEVGAKSVRRRFASLRVSPAFQGSANQFWKNFVTHPAFEIFFGMVVLTNAVFIGIDIQNGLGTSSTQQDYATLRKLGRQYAAAVLRFVALATESDGCSCFHKKLRLGETDFVGPQSV